MSADASTLNTSLIRRLATTIREAGPYECFDPLNPLIIAGKPFAEAHIPNDIPAMVQLFSPAADPTERVQAARNLGFKTGIAGWTLALNGEQGHNRYRAGHILGLNCQQADALFAQRAGLTAETAAAVLHHLADTGQVNWELFARPVAVPTVPHWVPDEHAPAYRQGYHAARNAIGIAHTDDAIVITLPQDDDCNIRIHGGKLYIT